MSDIKASALAGTIVRGYKIASQTDYLNCLRQLAEGYLFTGIESDWALKFEFLDKTSVFSITEDDLGVAVDKPSKTTTTETFLDEEDIPYRIIIEYIDSNLDWQVDAQQETRALEAVNSRKIMQKSFPIVFTATEARQLAQQALYLAWNERKKVSIDTFYKHIRIDPADIGTITIDGTAYTVRVTDVRYAANKIVTISASIFDSNVLTSTIPGDHGEYVEQGIYTIGISDFIFFDIPLLRDSDFTNSTQTVAYVGLYGFSSSWPGASLSRSTDGYAYDSVLSNDESIEYGYALNKLAAARNWETWDRNAVLTVDMVNGIPTSATDELDCLNNKTNAALLKSGDNWELIQYKDVVDNGDGTYTLSCLLRGLNGTEVWQGGHNGDDLFVMLSTDTIRKYAAPNGDIDLTRWYRADTFGSDETGDDQEITLVGNALKPWAVHEILGSRDGSNNLTVTWHRRTRANGEWLDGTETVPLNEETEAYEIDVIDPSDEETVLRTIDATSETCSYSAADQTTDGLTPGNDVLVRIYQMNSVVGRGFESEAWV